MNEREFKDFLNGKFAIKCRSFKQYKSILDKCLKNGISFNRVLNDDEKCFLFKGLDELKVSEIEAYNFYKTIKTMIFAYL